MGRRRELGRIDALLGDAAAARAGAVVLEGPSGIGKSRLLAAAAARADGFTRLAARGLESEAALAHAGLLDLLTPLRGHLPDVPPGQAAALAAALGWEPGSRAGDRLLVGAGTLALLVAAAEHRPLLVTVDDLQWLDAESTAALLFAVRRVHRDRLAVVLARRPGGPALDGLEVLSPAEFTLEEAADLLGPDVPAAVVGDLVGRVGGNPLALLEVTAGLRPAERRGSAPLPDELPVGQGLSDLFAPALADLSPGAVVALRLLAAAHDGRVDHLAAALGTGGIPAGSALDELEARSLVLRDGDRLSFRHPLLRTTVRRTTTPEQRRAAHRLLADGARTGDVVTRTWHRAQAAEGPDDDLADELAQVAGRTRARRGFAASSLALERSAELTTDGERYADRLAAAVTDAFLSGDVRRTRSLAARVLREDAGAPARAAALHALGRLEAHSGSVPVARDLLDEAGDLAEGLARTRVLAELAGVQHRLGDVRGMAGTAERIAAPGGAGGAEHDALVAWVRGAAHVHAGELADGRRWLRRAQDLMDGRPALRDEPGLLVYAMLCLSWLEDIRPAVPGVLRRIRAAREQGALGVLVAALSMSAYGRAQVLGDHVGAFADAGEAVELAEQLGYVADAAPAHELLAWEHAARGQHAEARRRLASARALVARAGTTAVAAHLGLTEAFCALCRGDLAEVVDVLEARIAADGGVGAGGEPLGVAPLLVEAYAGLGRAAEARHLAARYAEVSRPALPPTAALVARCAALAADGDAAEAAFQDSLAFHAEAPDGFETAHTLLLHGEWLRRSGRRSAAREPLGTAAGRFAAMDLAAWAQRAEDELAATGRTARPRRALPEEPLTPQETRIALLAAEGSSNREIAAALFLSPKTVEHHLSTVYRKRGLRSRAQLAALFAGPAP